MQSFIRNVYGIETDVIPAFVDVSPSIPRKALIERPSNSFFLWTKGHTPLMRTLIAKLQDALTDYLLAPSSPVKVTHEKFLKMLGERRYFITLSAAEGFCLPALEAMAMGTSVVGFDGFGGRDYM